MKSKFFSSLVVNLKKFPNAYMIFQPRFNNEYYKRLFTNIKIVKSTIHDRKDSKLMNLDYDVVAQDAQEIFNLKRHYGSLLKKKIDRPESLDEKIGSVSQKLEQCEDAMMPLILELPNRISPCVPTEDIIRDEITRNQNLSNAPIRLLNHIKLSFINQCFNRSVIGPNSRYHMGLGSKLQMALVDFFTERYSEKNYVHFSGMCIVKSAVVEAINTKKFDADSARILHYENSYKPVSDHLVESSLEAFIGFVSQLSHMNTYEPLRLVTQGSCYKEGTKELEPDTSGVSQHETVNLLSFCPSIDKFSSQEFENTKNSLWSLYKELGIPARFVHCSRSNLLKNEFDAYRIDIFLPSKKSWLQASRVSYINDYITIRTGMKRGHLVHTLACDAEVLSTAIIENNQTSAGSFIIPSSLREFFIALSATEKTKYFNNEHSEIEMVHAGFVPSSRFFKIMPLTIEQCRGLVKRSMSGPLFSHSKLAEKNRLGKHICVAGMNFCMFLIALAIWDYQELWDEYLPLYVKRFLYEKIYAPIIWPIYCWIEYDTDHRPKFLKPFDELDPVIGTRFDRAKAEFDRDTMAVKFLPSRVMVELPAETEKKSK